MKRHMLICLFVIMLVIKENEWNSLHFPDFCFLGKMSYKFTHTLLVWLKRGNESLHHSTKMKVTQYVFAKSFYDLFIHLEILEILLMNLQV
jgi:hypothetical protein